MWCILKCFTETISLSINFLFEKSVIARMLENCHVKVMIVCCTSFLKYNYACVDFPNKKTYIIWTSIYYLYLCYTIAIFLIHVPIFHWIHWWNKITNQISTLFLVKILVWKKSSFSKKYLKMHFFDHP